MKLGFVVIDFGSQFTQLIVRRFRELGYFAQVVPYTLAVEEIKKLQPLGIVLSGGPHSVYEDKSPYYDVTKLEAIAPLLGICYGMQLIAHQKGGQVEKSNVREYGRTEIEWAGSKLFQNNTQEVWMSHGDIVKNPPQGFKVTAKTHNGLPAAIESDSIWAIQFHPEVAHTQNGNDILNAFAKLCKATPSWDDKAIVVTLIEDLKTKVPEGRILCALSGGVDSSVTALLLKEAFGVERVECVFINNGLLRKNEFSSVLDMYQHLGLKVRGVDAEEYFLKELKGLSDPEQKRKAIGRCFIEVFESLLPELKDVKYLAQGTLYPDVVESVTPFGGPTHTIKSHHNVGGLPEKMKLTVVEPLRWLFKDEVRRIGEFLGLAPDMVNRHPFPGPGLGIRIMGQIEKADLQILREVDDIFISNLKSSGLYHNIWQAFCVLLPVHTVGVQGDGRTYEKVVALRAVTSSDGMTADWYDFEPQFLKRVSNEITNRVPGVNRVVYDITAKPPATIEWE